MSNRPPLSVRVTDDLAQDLAVLRRGGMTASDAVRHAVKLIAQGQRAAELLAVDNGRRRPATLSIHTRALYGRPAAYDGPDQSV